MNVTNVTLDKSSIELTEGETENLTATVSPSNAKNQKVIWTTSNSSIVTVDNGTLTAHKEGQAIITATSDDGGKTATCQVTVLSKAAPAQGSITLEPEFLDLKVGESAVISVTVESIDVTENEIKWRSNNDPVATVIDGKVTAVCGGSATITAETLDGLVSARCFVTVTQPVTGITLDKTSLFLTKGTIGTLKASVTPSNATNKNIIWSTSNESVATVANGTYYAKGVGNATITAKTEDGYYIAECSVTVVLSDNLCFTSVGFTTISLNKKGSPYKVSLLYSTDAEETWESYTIGQTIALADGESVSFKAGSSGNNRFSENALNYYSFKMGGEGRIKASGNVMSLLDEDCNKDSCSEDCFIRLFSDCWMLTSAPRLPATTLGEGCYESMFQDCTLLTTPPELPAKTLAKYCYEEMFKGCASLTTAPELPATTLAECCYYYMFSSCTSLTTAPELPATTLAENCYGWMFSGCTALTAAPELPATTLAENCYGGMFSSCKSLATAPRLPATDLAKSCYYCMFNSCTSLTAAPELPATTLDEYCYASMFWSCTSLISAPDLPATSLCSHCYDAMFYLCNQLSYIKMMAKNIWAADCLEEWVVGVRSYGTFVKNSAATWDVTGDSGVPEGWTIETSEN